MSKASQSKQLFKKIHSALWNDEHSVIDRNIALV